MGLWEHVCLALPGWSGDTALRLLETGLREHVRLALPGWSEDTALRLLETGLREHVRLAFPGWSEDTEVVATVLEAEEGENIVTEDELPEWDEAVRGEQEVVSGVMARERAWSKVESDGGGGVIWETDNPDVNDEMEIAGRREQVHVGMVREWSKENDTNDGVVWEIDKPDIDPV